MDTVTILRTLWRHRVLVAAVCMFAVMAGNAVLYRVSFPPKVESRKYEVGVAQARILLDTPSSQVVDVAAKGSDSLGVRANLIASLMVGGEVKSAIAQRAGLSPEKLIGVSELAEEPSPVAQRPGRDDFVLTTNVLTNTGGDQLPIIEVTAQAPNRAGAAALAAAAVSGLGDYLDTTAARQHIDDAERLQVTGLGRPQATVELKGPSTILAIGVAILLFIMGCAAILALATVAGGWRRATTDMGPLVDLRPDDQEVFDVEPAIGAGDPSRGETRPSPRRVLLVPSDDDEAPPSEPFASGTKRRRSAGG